MLDRLASLTVTTLFRTIASVVLGVAIAACVKAPPPTFAELTISAAGTYLLNGRLVKPERLEGALLAMHKSAPSLGLNVRAAPDATYHSIAVAVTTAQRVGIDTWFTTAAPAK